MAAPDGANLLGGVTRAWLSSFYSTWSGRFELFETGTQVTHSKIISVNSTKYVPDKIEN